MKNTEKPIFNRKLLLRLLAALLLLSVICLAGMASFVLIRQVTLAASAPGGLLGPSIVQSTGTPILDAQGNPLPGIPSTPNGQAVSKLTLTPWDGVSRVTILVLGLDYRDWAASEPASRSDTMILLTLDPVAKTAGILSIPRDMWVAIPGFKHGKINTAFYLGDAYKMPGGGPALAVKTVESLIGVPINYYAQIDFGAFVRFIDDIGGVKINVPNQITISLLGDGPRKTLKPGVQVLPGEWALAYARNRYTENGDFDRAQRQQQVIMAIRDRILSADILNSLVTKAPTLYNELASGVHTNLSLDEVVKLALLARTVPDANIKRGIIDKTMVYFGKSPDNLDILIPIPDDIELLRDQIFTTSGALSPQTPGNDQERMKAEAAKLIVYNASSASDLANRTADYLRQQGANVTQVAKASQNYGSTKVVDHTGNPYLLKYLVNLMKIAPGNISIQYDPGSALGVEVFLGDDWARNNSLP